LIVIGGIFSQYSNVFVSGSIQALSNQLTLPLVTLLVYVVFQRPFSRLEVIGITIVVIGSLIGIVLPLIYPPPIKEAAYYDDEYRAEYNHVFWILLFVASDIPSAITNVYEDYILNNDRFMDPRTGQKIDEIHYLAYSNLFSLIGYILALPCMLIPKIGNLHSIHELYENQRDAVTCFLGHYDKVDGCEADAYIPIVSFVMCVCIYFYMLAVLIKQENTVYQVIVQSLITPISVIAFSSETIMHKHAETLSYYQIIACMFIPIGILLYKYRDIVHTYDDYEIHMARADSGYASSRDDQEILPLIARH